MLQTESLTQQPNESVNYPKRFSFKKMIIGIIVVLIIITVVYFLFVKSSFINPPKVTIGNNTFIVAVAKKDAELTKGLSGLTNLSKNRGMLFVFPKSGNYSFWMKNVKFPIDIIFINDRKIVNIVKNAAVPKNNNDLKIYQPASPVNQVLEINAGLSDSYGFKAGDSIKVQNLK